MDIQFIEDSSHSEKTVEIEWEGTRIKINDYNWSDNEGLLLQWNFPCPFWNECDASHCDLTDGKRSHGRSCSMPYKVTK